MKYTRLKVRFWPTIFSVPLLWLIPQMTFAQTRNLQGYLESITSFVNDTIIPLLFTLAILFLFVNVTKYFVIDASDSYKREEARTYILYAVIALVFITSLWGVINLVTSALNIDSNVPICPDYIQGGGQGCSSNQNQSSQGNYNDNYNPFGDF